MLLDEPAQAVPGTDFLVGDDEEHEISRGDEALAGERGERDRARRHLILHVERAAPPDLAVDEVARPGIALPLGGVREHGVGMGQEREGRTVAALDPGDEVRAVRLAGEELALHAVLGEVVAGSSAACVSFRAG